MDLTVADGLPLGGRHWHSSARLWLEAGLAAKLHSADPPPLACTIKLEPLRFSDQPRLRGFAAGGSGLTQLDAKQHARRLATGTKCRDSSCPSSSLTSTQWTKDSLVPWSFDSGTECDSAWCWRLSSAHDWAQSEGTAAAVRPFIMWHLFSRPPVRPSECALCPPMELSQPLCMSHSPHLCHCPPQVRVLPLPPATCASPPAAGDLGWGLDLKHTTFFFPCYSGLAPLVSLPPIACIRCWVDVCGSLWGSQGLHAEGWVALCLQQSHWPVLGGTTLAPAHHSCLSRSPRRVGLHHSHCRTFSRIFIQVHPGSPEPRHGILAQRCSPRVISSDSSDSSVVARRWQISMARRRKKDRRRRRPRDSQREAERPTKRAREAKAKSSRRSKWSGHL